MLKNEVSYVSYLEIMGVNQYNLTVMMNLYLPVVHKVTSFYVAPNTRLAPTFYGPILFKRFISK